MDADLGPAHIDSDSDDMFATGDDDVLPSNVDALSDAVDTTAAAVAERVATGKVQVNAAGGGHALERDDAEGYLHVHVGEALDDAGRYKIVGIIGRGVFSSVAMATDQVDGASVAVKILRANTTMRKAGEHERELLEHVVACGHKSGAGSAHVVRLLDTFDARGHLCLVFEAMTRSLKELLDSVGQKRGLSFGAVRALTQQLLLGLGALHAAGVVHADLKPQNCLVLQSSHGVLAKIADLGSGFRLTDPENVPAPYLVSRWYRAPEVILGCEHSPALDMWSLACVVYELYTGETLFTGADNSDMLLQQQRMLGRFPKRMARRNLQAAATANVREHFSAVDHRFLHATALPGGGSTLQPMALPEKPAPGCSIAERLAGRHDPAASSADTQALVSFLNALLAADPARRLTVQQALAHPFITSTGVTFAPRAAASVAQARAAAR